MLPLEYRQIVFRRYADQGIKNQIMKIIVFDQAVVRFKPNAVFGAADVAVPDGRTIASRMLMRGITGGAACNITILDRHVRRIDNNSCRTTITHYHARVVDGDFASDIKPVNDLSSGA